MRNVPLLDSLLALFILACILLACIVLAGCTPTAQGMVITAPVPATSTPVAANVPQLRIRNSGSADIHNLTVRFPNSRISFGDVPAGATTQYLPAPKGVYNFAAYEYEVNGKTVTQPVRDWMGESPRPGAAYTYTLALDSSQPGGPLINLIEVMAENAE
jgi:hypothetical protein